MTSMTSMTHEGIVFSIADSEQYFKATIRRIYVHTYIYNK